ncbi:HutD family protein [Lactobacillus sp. UCMA15818]|uniref:HutD family protein n=1 Tax=Lactobacillaceae TaxID=33958 RepID=UPI0025B16D00|nr:HutD family protein [Lactobacillus sp. UCMA15818]MDN2453488.1 HutD family protein [Lactobacillus sp. UCMA15818]
MAKICLKRASEFKTTRWSGGQTTELYIYPAGSLYENRDFGFRLSFATVEVDKSKFTSLSGYKRIIMPLTNPIELVNNSKTTRLIPGQSFNFAGSDLIESRGVSKDVNLMHTSDFAGQISTIDDNSDNKLNSSWEHLCLYNLGGKRIVTIKDQKLNVGLGDCVIINNINRENLEIKIEISGNKKKLILFEVKKGD